MPSPLDLAAVLIVRNEARCIARCLDSVRPWIDRIVVLDTGSTDDTAAIAEARGAEVHHFTWADDFSLARNRSLDLADAAWNLVIDADEWVSEGGETLRDWCAAPTARLGKICQVSSFDARDGGADAAGRNWVTRLLPRGVRYEGRVHEQAVSPLPRMRTALHVDHDGYRDSQIEAKRERNLPLLLQELAARPGDPYILYQLGKEAEGRGDYATACTRYGAALDTAPERANWGHELLVRHLHCLGRAGRTAEAIALAERTIAAWQDSPDFFFVLGNLLLDRAVGDPAHAVGHWLPLAGTAWERCIAIGERPDLEGSVAGRGSHLAQHNLDIVRSQIALLAR